MADKRIFEFPYTTDKTDKVIALDLIGQASAENYPINLLVSFDELTTVLSDYYTKTELDGGALNTLYYTQAEIDALIAASPNTFIENTDTPSSYFEQEDKILIVNQLADALEFAVKDWVKISGGTFFGNVRWEFTAIEKITLQDTGTAGSRIQFRDSAFTQTGYLDCDSAGNVALGTFTGSVFIANNTSVLGNLTVSGEGQFDSIVTIGKTNVLFPETISIELKGEFGSDHRIINAVNSKDGEVGDIMRINFTSRTDDGVAAVAVGRIANIVETVGATSDLVSGGFEFGVGSGNPGLIVGMKLGASGEFFLPNLDEASDTDVLFFNTGTGKVTHSVYTGLIYKASTDTWTAPTTLDGQTQDLGQELFNNCLDPLLSGETSLNPKVFVVVGDSVADANFLEVIKPVAGDLNPGAVYGINTTDVDGITGKFKMATYGFTKGVNTSAWGAGTYLYVDETTAGDLTDLPPITDVFFVGLVTKQDAINGEIYIATAVASSGTPVTTPGVYDIGWFTGDVSDTPPYYSVLRDDKGAVAQVIQTQTVGNNTTLPLPIDWLSLTYAVPGTVRKGVYDGGIETVINNAQALERVEVEVYLAQTDGTAIDSGIATAPVGTLGVPVLCIMDSGIRNLNAAITHVVSVIGVIEEDVPVAIGERVRFRVLVSKVGTGGPDKQFDIYHGYDHQTYIRLPDVMALGDLGDVVITIPTTGDILKYNASGIWVNTVMNANEIVFNNVPSSLVATNVQDAIDEIYAELTVNPGYVNLTTAQTAAGEKTWTDNARFNSSVGIGKAPTDKLDIAGGNVLLDNNYGLRIKDSGGTHRIVAHLNVTDNLLIGDYDIDFVTLKTSGAILFNSGSLEKMRLIADGKLGLGISAPITALQLNQGVGSLSTGLSFGDGDTGIYENIDDDLYFVDALAGTVSLYELALGNMNWRNIWLAGAYVTGDTVKDGDYTMWANKDTTDRPSPQPQGPAFYAYDGPNTTNSDTVKQMIFGTRYEVLNGAFINGYRVYVVTGNHYTIYSVNDPLGVAQVTERIAFTATETGWTEFGLVPILAPIGLVFDIVAVVSEPDPTPSIWSSNYDYQTPNNIAVPANGEIIHANNALSILSIAKTDNDLNDRTILLGDLEVGDFIEGAGMRWAIQNINDQGTYINFSVAPAQQGAPDGVQNFDFETVVATPITYLESVNHWLAQVNVEGLFIADGKYEDIVPDDNAYGTDLLLQDAYVSPDWELVALSGGGGGGESGGGVSPWTVDANGINYQLGGVGIGADSIPTHSLNVDGGVLLSTGAANGLYFGDGGAGIYEVAENVLSIVLNDQVKYSFFISNFRAELTGAFQINEGAASDTVPSYTFFTDSDTGVGHVADDNLSLIVGGVEGLRIDGTTNPGYIRTHLNPYNAVGPNTGLWFDDALTGIYKSGTSELTFVDASSGTVALADLITESELATELLNYVDIAGDQNITGQKTFLDTLFIGAELEPWTTNAPFLEIINPITNPDSFPPFARFTSYRDMVVGDRGRIMWLFKRTDDSIVNFAEVASEIEYVGGGLIDFEIGLLFKTKDRDSASIQNTVSFRGDGDTMLYRGGIFFENETVKIYKDGSHNLVFTDPNAGTHTLNDIVGGGGNFVDLTTNQTAAGVKTWSDQGVFTLGALFATSNLGGLYFGDGDTGIYENSANDLYIIVNATARWHFTSSVFEATLLGTSPSLKWGSGTSTNPVYAFGGDPDTGIGTAGANVLSLIAGAIESIHIPAVGDMIFTDSVTGSKTLAQLAGGTSPWTETSGVITPATSGWDVRLASGEVLYFGDSGTSSISAVAAGANPSIRIADGGTGGMSFGATFNIQYTHSRPGVTDSVDIGTTGSNLWFRNVYAQAYYVDDATAYISYSGTELQFTDAVTGTKTLAELAGGGASPWLDDTNGIQYGLAPDGAVGIGTASTTSDRLTVVGSIRIIDNTALAFDPDASPGAANSFSIRNDDTSTLLNKEVAMVMTVKGASAVNGVVYIRAYAPTTTTHEANLAFTLRNAVGGYTTPLQLYSDGTSRFESNVGIGIDPNAGIRVYIQPEVAQLALTLINRYAYSAWVDYPSSLPNRIMTINREAGNAGINDYTAISLHCTSASGKNQYAVIAVSSYTTGDMDSRLNFMLRGDGTTEYNTVLSMDQDSTYYWKTETDDITHYFVQNGVTTYTFGVRDSDGWFILTTGNDLNYAGATFLIRDDGRIFTNLDSDNTIPSASTALTAAIYVYTTQTSNSSSRYSSLQIRCVGTTYHRIVDLVAVSESSSNNATEFRVRVRTSSAYIYPIRARSNGDIFFDELNNATQTNYLRYNSSSGLVTYLSSDRSLKKEIKPFKDDALTALMSFDPKTWLWKKNDDKGAGWIAQEGVEAIPEMFPINTKDNLYGINEFEILPYYHRAIQQLKAEIDELRSQLNN